MSAAPSRPLAIVMTLQSFLLSAWVGGALLFVITSVAEQISPTFDSVARDQLATIRFPLYYVFCAATLGPAAVCGLVGALLRRNANRGRQMLILILTLLSGTGAALDYVFVYSPLQALITPPGKARDMEFVTLHIRSRNINTLHVSLALVAAVAACIPAKARMQD